MMFSRIELFDLLKEQIYVNLEVYPVDENNIRTCGYSEIIDLDGLLYPFRTKMRVRVAMHGKIDGVMELISKVYYYDKIEHIKFISLRPCYNNRILFDFSTYVES